MVQLTSYVAIHLWSGDLLNQNTFYDHDFTNKKNQNHHENLDQNLGLSKFDTNNRHRSLKTSEDFLPNKV